MFYSLGMHWCLMESCKNLLENNSDFLFSSLFHFLKLLKTSAQHQLLLKPHLGSPYGMLWSHVLTLTSRAAKWDVGHQRLWQNKGYQERWTLSNTNPADIQVSVNLRDCRNKIDAENGTCLKVLSASSISLEYFTFLKCEHIIEETAKLCASTTSTYSTSSWSLITVI